MPIANSGAIWRAASNKPIESPWTKIERPAPPGRKAVTAAAVAPES